MGEGGVKALTWDDCPDGPFGGVKMARKTALRSADELLSPAIERTVQALDPPDSDDAVVALARILAKTVDRMTDAERAAMIGQTAPQLLRVLVELEQRALERRKVMPKRQPSRLDEMRAARAAADAGRRGRA